MDKKQRTKGVPDLNVRASNTVPSPLDIRGDLNNAAIAAKIEPRKPRFSLFDILRFVSARNDR